MSEEATQATEGANAKPSREQSTIQFPYGDLNDVIAVAKALVDNGGHPADVDQLAGMMKQKPNSGNFRLKIATARMFGAIETVANKYTLTDLGFDLVDDNRKKTALADAFLNVPLYRKVYDDYRQRQLPPRPVALERAFIGYGVAPKQADKARHAFDRSGRIAGYFDHGNDRLIRPITVSAVGSTKARGNTSHSVEEPADDNTVLHRRNKGSGGGGDGYHPFVEGLLKTLPEPNTVWAVEGRAAWLEAAASVFNLLYQGNGRITVCVSSEGSNHRD